MFWTIVIFIFIHWFTRFNLFNGILFACICSCISQLPFITHMPLQRYSSQKSIYYLLNPFCIKFVTIYLSDCNFAVVYYVRLARRETGSSPPVKYFTDRSKAVLLLWIFYVFVLSCVCYVFVHVCLYVLCGHLLGKG